MTTYAPRYFSWRHPARRLLSAGLVALVLGALLAVLPGPVPAVGQGAPGGAMDHFPRTVGLNSQGQPEKFWVSDGIVWHSYRTGQTWSAPGPLGGPPGGVAAHQVGYERNAPGNGELFVVGADGNVWHMWATPGRGSGWSGWWSLARPPGSSVSGEAVVGRNRLDNQELFVRASDGQVWHRYATPGVGSGWSAWSSLGAPSSAVVGDVHVSLNSLGNQELYVRTADGRVWHRYATPGVGPGWSAWSPLGGPGGVSSDVAVWRNWRGDQELFLLADGRVWHMWATPGVGSGWSGWYPLAALPGGAGASGFLGLDDSRLVGSLTLWVRDTAGQYWSIALSGSTWGAWSNRGPATPGAAGPETVLFGHDFSWPQCSSAQGGFGLPLPPTSTQFVVVGLTRGLAFTVNPCLAAQVAWVKGNGVPAHAYAMATFPTDAQLTTYGSAGPWDPATRANRLRNVGYAEAAAALSSLASVSWSPPVVWIDVEPRPAQPWPSATSAQRIENRYVIAGLMRGLQDAGVGFGLYSYTAGWQEITGSWALPGVPVWATAGQLDYPTEALDRCTQPSFSGGPVYISQWYDSTRDYDRTCGPYGFTPFLVSIPVDA